ncbi:MAG: riboflavin biosynthesis protein RibF [Chloroflexi bacterium]|nr:MAG: riboflavin biosynthesis protein RibF [Chloroflexota bacterium]
MLVHGWTGWPHGPLHFTFGVFDGVHRGHRALLSELREGARAAGARAVVGTFDVHPARVVAPQRAPLALSSAEEKIELLQQAGADDVVLWTFDRDFAALEAEAFVLQLAKAGDVRHVLAGFDLVFGHDRRGDVRLLRELSPRFGYTVSEAGEMHFEGGAISSTRIRMTLAEGRIEEANAMLGREYGVRGTVVHGAGRGRGLGFPTINIATPSDRQLPADGIYAMRVAVDGELLPAAANLGVRPTFEDAGSRLLEAHLLDVDRDLYGKQVEARFVRRIREERRFANAEELSARIALDVDAVRRALDS